MVRGINACECIHTHTHRLTARGGGRRVVLAGRGAGEENRWWFQTHGTKRGLLWKIRWHGTFASWFPWAFTPEACSSTNAQHALAWGALVIFPNRVSGIVFPSVTVSDWLFPPLDDGPWFLSSRPHLPLMWCQRRSFSLQKRNLLDGIFHLCRNSKAWLNNIPLGNYGILVAWQNVIKTCEPSACSVRGEISPDSWNISKSEGKTEGHGHVRQQHWNSDISGAVNSYPRSTKLLYFLHLHLFRWWAPVFLT